MDYLEDSSRRILHAIDKAAPGANIVKVAEACTSDDTAKLPPQSFADIVGRQFPVHTKEATILSAAYAAYNGANSAIQDRITKLACFWECEEEVKRVRSAIEGYRPKEKYALDMEIAGRPVKAFSFSTGASLKNAARDFYDQRARLPLSARRETAATIAKNANSMGVDLETKVAQYIDAVLGIGIPNQNAANEMLLTRKHATVKEKDQETGIRKLAISVKEECDSLSPESGERLVAAFSEFDEKYGVAKRYDGGGIELPEDTLFPVPFNKLAGKTDTLVELKNGVVVDINELDWDKVSEVDPELYTACKQGDPKTASDVLPTWPRSDVELLTEMLSLHSCV